MNLCKGCEPRPIVTSFVIDINRTNFCQMITVFISSWLRGDKTATLNLHSRRTAGTEDNTERYYANMEHARNYHEDEYFKARPQADCIANRTLFKAGFERAFKFLWEQYQNAEADMLRLHVELMELKYPGSSPTVSDSSP